MTCLCWDLQTGNIRDIHCTCFDHPHSVYFEAHIIEEVNETCVTIRKENKGQKPCFVTLSFQCKGLEFSVKAR